MRNSKLVRDKIPDIIKQSGKDPIAHIASDGEYLPKLKDKLKEEVNEFLEKGNEEELADIFEIVYAICDFKGISKDKLDSIRKKKLEERGGFKKKIILDEIL